MFLVTILKTMLFINININNLSIVDNENFYFIDSRQYKIAVNIFFFKFSTVSLNSIFEFLFDIRLLTD